MEEIEPVLYTEGETEALLGRRASDVLESMADRSRRGKGSSRFFTSSGQVAVVFVEGKPEPCPVCFFIARVCPGFHGNWLWTPGRKVAPCGDGSDFPLPGPSLKPSDSSPHALWSGWPRDVPGAWTKDPKGVRLVASVPRFPQATLLHACSVPSPNVGA